MDAHLFRLFAEHASSFLDGAMIEKLQEPQPGLLIFALYNRGQKRQFVFRYGKRQPFCFFTSMRLAANKPPSAQLMRIRKYFAQKVIAAVIFQVWERKLWLLAGKQAQEDGRNPWLCLDFARGATLFFLNDSELPAHSSVIWPDRQNLADAMENWRSWPVLTPALRKTLVLLEEADKLALLSDLEEGGGDVFLYKKDMGSPVSVVSPWPLAASQAGDLREQACENVLECLEEAGRDLVLSAAYEKKNADIEEKLKYRRRHLEKLLANLQKDKERLLLMVQGEKGARYLQANLWKLERHRKLENIQGDNGECILLDKRYTLAENMQRLFNSMSRGKRGLKILAERKALLEKELAEIKNGSSYTSGEERAIDSGAIQKSYSRGVIGKLMPRDVSVFRSSDGFIILRGKNARGNARIRHMASGHDLWAHVEQGQGAHVVIRCQYPGQIISPVTLDEAGSLAANKSWLSGADQAAVMYAEVRHVKPMRKGGQGQVSIDRLAFTRLVPVNHSLENTLAV